MNARRRMTASAAILIGAVLQAGYAAAQYLPPLNAPFIAPYIDTPRDRVMVDPRRNTAGTNMSRERIIAPDERRWTAGTNAWREGQTVDERRSTAATNVVREREWVDDQNAKRGPPAPDTAWRDAQRGRARTPPEPNPELAPERITAIRNAQRAKQKP